MTIQEYAERLVVECKDYGHFEDKFLIVDSDGVWIATEETSMRECVKIEQVI